MLEIDGIQGPGLEVDGVDLEVVVIDDMLAQWKPTIEWVTTQYSYIGWKRVTVVFSSLPPKPVKIHIVMGNGNNGNVWATKDYTTAGNRQFQIESNTTGLYATVVVYVSEVDVLGTICEGGNKTLTKAPRAYQIGDNLHGTIETRLF